MVFSLIDRFIDSNLICFWWWFFFSMACLCLFALWQLAKKLLYLSLSLYIIIIWLISVNVVVVVVVVSFNSNPSLVYGSSREVLLFIRSPESSSSSSSPSLTVSMHLEKSSNRICLPHKWQDKNGTIYWFCPLHFAHLSIYPFIQLYSILFHS